MNCFDFSFQQAALRAMPSGALWWPDANILCVSDLHLGKSERVGRRAGLSLPPYETQDTLARLESDLEKTNARIVICLGDSFDDLSAANSLPDPDRLWIARLQAGRRWIWIEGNHDPGPVEFGGEHLQQTVFDTLTFRHIAQETAIGEVSGHFHPKARIALRGRAITRPAFLFDEDRLILPAYGTYTGGLQTDHPALTHLMRPNALAILTGPVPTCIPMPR
ncbi:MAG: ligase-associated DNA damage response endonuclease PdeM [Roseobacter sp.]